MRIATVLLTLCSLLALGCYKTTYTRGPADPLTKENPKFHHIAALGFVEMSKPIAIHELCPEGVSRVDVRGNFLTGLIGTVAHGLYSPRMTFVQCTSGSAYNLEVDEAGIVVSASQVAWSHQ